MPIKRTTPKTHKSNGKKRGIKKAPNKKLRQCVEDSLKQYFKDMNGEEAAGVYEMVLSEIEKPLFSTVLQHADHNQSKASRILGINRNTLRKKLDRHGLGE